MVAVIIILINAIRNVQSRWNFQFFSSLDNFWMQIFPTIEIIKKLTGTAEIKIDFFFSKLSTQFFGKVSNPMYTGCVPNLNFPNWTHFLSNAFFAQWKFPKMFYIVFSNNVPSIHNKQNWDFFQILIEIIHVGGIHIWFHKYNLKFIT